MFRYERPQKGRQRQFHQIGIELLGVAGPAGRCRRSSPAGRRSCAIWACSIARCSSSTRWAIARAAPPIASPWSAISRPIGRSSPPTAASGWSAIRCASSIPRIEGDRALIAEAPRFGEYLNQKSRDFFAAVTGGLEALGIAYQLNPRLVRGLDYYCHTAFEFTTTELGAQGTVMGGGRYDGLIDIMGGPATAGIGWAAGIERMAMMLAETPAARRPMAVVPMGAAPSRSAAGLAERLRRAGFAVELGYGGNIGKRLKRADKLGGGGGHHPGRGRAGERRGGLRDLDSGEQTAVPLAELEERLARFR